MCVSFSGFETDCTNFVQSFIFGLMFIFCNNSAVEIDVRVDIFYFLVCTLSKAT